MNNTNSSFDPDDDMDDMDELLNAKPDLSSARFNEEPPLHLINLLIYTTDTQIATIAFLHINYGVTTTGQPVSNLTVYMITTTNPPILPPSWKIKQTIEIPTFSKN